MAKRKQTDGEEGVKETPSAPAAPAYRITGGRTFAIHPRIGMVTKDHIEGPKAGTFIRAFLAHDKQTGGNWTATNIEEV